jgi:hypothetical protein
MRALLQDPPDGCLHEHRIVLNAEGNAEPIPEQTREGSIACKYESPIVLSEGLTA